MPLTAAQLENEKLLAVADMLGDAPSGQIVRRAANEIGRLRAAITITLAENGHLADGENCTLKHLTAAIAANT